MPRSSPPGRSAPPSDARRRQLSALRLIAVGRLGSGPEATLFDRYNARLRPRLAVTEIEEAAGQPKEAKRREAVALLSALPKDGFAVALDLGGAAPDSAALARLLERWMGQARPVCFLVGGAEGLDSDVLSRANYVLSFGEMTWPHMLARVMLAEQLFRAQAIAANRPYHRAGRP